MLYEVGIDNLNYDQETGVYVDTFDYEAAGLFSPSDCDGDRLCFGCKFECECCGLDSEANEVLNMIKIPVGNGINIVAEQGTNTSFPREIYIGIVNDNDMWLQDLAIVRQAYSLSSGDEDGAKYIDGEYQVLVFSDKDNEDYTHKFDVKECEHSSL